MGKATSKIAKNVNASKKERLEARISSDLKHKLERAAAIKGMNVSSFVIRHIEEATDVTIAEHEHRRLSKEDQQAFFETLMNPPEPNAKLLEAAEKYFRS